MEAGGSTCRRGAFAFEDEILLRVKVRSDLSPCTCNRHAIAKLFLPHRARVLYAVYSLHARTPCTAAYARTA